MALAKALLLPPGLNLFVILLGLACFSYRRKRIGIILILLSCLLLYLLSTPFLSSVLIGPLSRQYPPLTLSKSKLRKYKDVRAIVVLAGGRSLAPEYRGMTVSPITLVRLRYATRLWRKVRLPILVSGGAYNNDKRSEASLMARVLRREFSVPVRWQERRSHNTFENAKYTARILANHKIKKVFLVTSAWHMPRAIYSFRHFGLQVVAAPTGYSRNYTSLNIHNILPSIHALYTSRTALHEYLGLIWYKWH